MPRRQTPPENGRLLDQIINTPAGERTFSVSAYLDLLNTGLAASGARIKGEVSSVEVREKAVYFSLKDAADSSVINCLIWQSNYRVSGLKLEIGLEVIATGAPEIYKPYGKLSFKANTVELVGEGALRAAYEKLKAKLEAEGLFAPERKKALIPWPERVGLITSRQGAVISDLLNNLGRHGFHIYFHDSPVEGAAAGPALLSALQYFQTQDLDALVIIRGGGSLESMAAFNNEILVRAIAQFPQPVICGLGHDKDMPLAALAADLSCSTPSIVTNILNASWEEAAGEVRIFERDIVGGFQTKLYTDRRRLDGLQGAIFAGLETVLRQFAVLDHGLKQAWNRLLNRLALWRQELHSLAGAIALNDPKRQLRLGYSLVRHNGKLVRSVEQVTMGDALKVQLSDGELETILQAKHKDHV